MTEHVRRLIVLRHAKAHPVGPSDHDRQLTPAGHRDAVAAGHWARDSNMLPDHALVSSAQRTVATWEGFREGAGIDVEATLEGGLYAGGPDAALEILRTVPADAATVILVGHNPTVSHLVHLLDDGTAEPEVFAQVASGYPTCALSVLELADGWAELDHGGARIVAFHVGRG